jgi:hypothetical protein
MLWRLRRNGGEFQVKFEKPGQGEGEFKETAVSFFNGISKRKALTHTSGRNIFFSALFGKALC